MAKANPRSFDPTDPSQYEKSEQIKEVSDHILVKIAINQVRNYEGCEKPTVVHIPTKTR